MITDENWMLTASVVAEAVVLMRPTDCNYRFGGAECSIAVENVHHNVMLSPMCIMTASPLGFYCIKSAGDDQ